jgi:hypothetical protein
LLLFGFCPTVEKCLELYINIEDEPAWLDEDDYLESWLESHCLIFFSTR